MTDQSLIQTHLEPFSKNYVKSISSCAAPSCLWVLAVQIGKDADGDDELRASFSRAIGMNTYLFENDTTTTAVLFVDPVSRKLHDSSEIAEGVLCYYLWNNEENGSPMYRSGGCHTKIKLINSMSSEDSHILKDVCRRYALMHLLE